MSRIKDSEFIYAVSRIRAMENKLLGQMDFERLMDAQTSGQAMKVLTDAGYGINSPESDSKESFNKLMDEEFMKLYSMLREVSPVPEVFDIFLQPYDFNNIKVILKAEFAGTDGYERMLTDKGSMSTELITEILLDRRLNDLPSLVREAVEEAIEELSHTHDPQTVDLILDRACFRRMREMAGKTHSSYLTDYIDEMTDVVNIQIVIRLKKLNKDNEIIQRAILPGGRIKWEKIEDMQGIPVYRLVNILLDEAHFDKPLGFGTDRDVGIYLAMPERLMEEFTNRYISIGKGDIDGLKPLVGYMLRKQSELRQVRVIMTSLLNGLPPGEIRESLRRVYA